MKRVKWIKMDSFTGIFQRYWPKKGILPGEVTMAIPNRVKVNPTKCHGGSLWKWPIKENYIFYFNHDVVKAIEPPEMRKCGLRIFFKIKEMDELDDKWYPIELIIYAIEHFFHFMYCYKNLEVKIYLVKFCLFCSILFVIVQVMDIQWN